jgi:hypothetical protein
MPAMTNSPAKCFVIASLLLSSSAALAQEEGEEGAVDETGAPMPVSEETTETTALPEETTTTEEAPPAEEAPAGSLAPTISGMVYGSYNINVMNPDDGANGFYSFNAQHNTFALNAAHVAITGNDDKLSYVVELDGGTDLGGGYGVVVQEAYLAYTGEGGMGFKAGQFVTTMGIEVIESPLNPTISRGFLFGLAEPFGHTGALFTYKASDTLDIAAGLINGWDLALDNNEMKTFMGKVGLTQEKMVIVGSLLAGPETAGNDDDYRIAADVTGVLKGDAMDIWFQGNFGMETGDASATWFGATVQPVYRMSDTMNIGARAEVFIDSDGVRTGFGDSLTLINAAVAPALKVHDNVWVRGEARLDFATEDVYAAGDEAGAIQVVGLTEAVVTF